MGPGHCLVLLEVFLSNTLLPCRADVDPEETHENAIRILVEEAKVNLCLRSVGMHTR